MRAARLLWDMIFSYFNRDLYRAGTQANALSADAGDLTALLYDGTFRPSTAALYEQIIKDLEEGGFVEPNEDSPE